MERRPPARQMGAVLIAALAAGALAAPAVAQSRVEREAFTWVGTVPEGRWIMVRNLRGTIEVTRGGNRVEVIATRRTRRGDPHFVRFEVQKFGAGGESALICALWGENSECSESGYRTRTNNRGRDHDVQVDFSVRVPRGVRVAAHLVNGDVRVVDAAAEVDASSVNGDVVVSTVGSGDVRARTTNGAVRATIGELDGTSDLRFTSVNGSVTAEFAADINADIELSTTNGRFSTDFPVTIRGRIDPRRLRATLGKGGPRILLSTVNGNVELRKR